MQQLRVVIDSNVFYAALRSRHGASHRLLLEIDSNDSFQIQLSPPLVFEYEEITKRDSRVLGLSHAEIGDVLDYLCSVAGLNSVFYLWRPCLPDPDDDMLLELAVAAECQRIVTFNLRDFHGIDQFGIKAVTPQTFLREIGVLP
jgi:predicted nucleic acid-binding protein